MSNKDISKSVKEAKKAIKALLQKGFDVEMIANTTKLSLSLIKEVEEEYINKRRVSGIEQRSRIRYNLVDEIPTILNKMKGLVDEDVERSNPQFAFQVYRTILSFAAKYVDEDRKVTYLEEAARDKTHKLADQPMLFDFQTPDNET